MAKRSSGAGLIIYPILYVLGTLYSFVVAHYVGLIIAIIIISILISLAKAKKRKNLRIRYEAYKQSLIEKYKNEALVDRLLNSEFWVGQTEEQLKDSLGAATAIETEKLKTKTKEIWKYKKIRKGQFRLRITLENGKVVGWVDKQS